MFKKITQRQLVFMLGIFLVIILIDKVWNSGEKESNFDKDFINLDSTAISSMVITSKVDNFEEVILAGTGDKWTVQKGNVQASANMDMVKNIINELIVMEPGRLAAKSDAKWKEFEVDDSSGTRLQVMENGETTLDLIIGKFSFQQQKRSGLTYIRLSGKDEVYAVESFIAMAFSQGFNALRDNNIIKGNVMDWTKVSINFPGDSSYTLVKNGNNWTCDFADVDSAEVANYLTTISSTRGVKYEDEFSENTPAKYAITIEGNNKSALQLNVFEPDSGRYVIHSSLNPDTYFGDDGNLFKRLFRKSAGLMAKEEEPM